MKKEDIMNTNKKVLQLDGLKDLKYNLTEEEMNKYLSNE